MLQSNSGRAHTHTGTSRSGLICARNEKRWSQQEMADQLGISLPTVGRWERGATRPSRYFRQKLCQIFETSPEALDLTEQTRVHDTFSPPGTQHGLQTLPSHPPFLLDPTTPLPPPWRLLGRDSTLAELKAQLCSSRNAATCALFGLPGVGKTALTIMLAHDPQVREMFPDGVLWAALGPDPDLLRVFSRWGTLLGMPEAQMSRLSSPEAWALALRSAIGARALLLIVDDVWSLEDALALQVGGVQCACILTTRSPAVANSLTTHATRVGELGEQEGIRLLTALAGEMVYREPEAAKALVHAVGALPLALVLMGRSLRLASLSGQARRVHQALACLRNAQARLELAEPQAPVERHPSLTAETPLSLLTVIAVSVERLAAHVQAALFALAAFPAKPHSFTEEAALEAADCTVETLDTLFDAGLLESAGPGHYSLHQTIIDFARYQQEQRGIQQACACGT